MHSSRRGERPIPPVEGVRSRAIPLTGADRDRDRLMELVGDARFVLLGEASHGTHEFYSERAAITRRLIEEMEFTAVAVEADWPDAHRIHEYVTGAVDGDASDALSGFRAFPGWMWRNTDVLEFVEWLRSHNASRPGGRPPVGFYGLDLYSLFASIQAVLAYLDVVDPDAAVRARHRYACFEHFVGDPQAYGYAASLNVTRSCRDQVVGQLVELQRLAGVHRERGAGAEEAQFVAEENARLVRDAEAYYRTLFEGGVSSWNLRDRHMVETLESVVRHQRRLGREPRIVVWAHNSHLGDARATEMGERGEFNLGQLVRERWFDAARLVGFTTYDGTVTAASAWDEPARHMDVRPALEGSYEALFHETGVECFLLPLERDAEAAEASLAGPRLERAIGVVYRPRSERISHYFEARLASQFDAVLHFDRTTAVRPIDPSAEWSKHAEQETYPYGL